MRATVGFALLALVAVSHAYDKVIVFGDSLSDMGNVDDGTFGIQPGSDYWQGRFSNGNVWIERLCTRLGLPLAMSRSNGTNWAHGGAQTGTGTYGFLFIQFPNVRTQVTRYLNSNPAIGEENLFVVWAGANDYFDGQTDPTVPVSNLSSAIATLYARGARKFLVPNIPLLGNIPSYLGTPEAEAMNLRSLQHNMGLASSLASLRQSSPGADIIELDIAGDLTDMQAFPFLWGLTNVTQPALTTAGNDDEFLFFDDVHPTRIGHQALSDVAFDAISPAHALNGTINLGDWVGTGSVPVTLRLWKGPLLMGTYETNRNPSMEFEVMVQRTGNYSLTIDSPHFLRKRVSVTLTTAPLTVSVSLVNGDADSSGEVDAGDIDFVIAQFGGSDTMADLDGSTEVDAADIDIAITNFGAVGE
ncbi:MAG: SGNH/GDSL hydrolase family protein [Fimbriimonadaceae bacterium]|nr:SGNH/GDSL hydrolase family protein [Fimbriimonadaceae bacterium]